MAKRVARLLTVLLLGFAPVGAAAQDYPNRPVRILVPYAAGGPSDAGARLIAEPLGRHLGQSVFVENRGGAGGLTGTEAVVSGDHDGYTILLGAVGPLVFMPAAKATRYDVSKDLVPLGLIWRSPQVLAVNPKLGVKTLAEFVAYAKKNPGKVTIASAGVGTVTHMAGELLKLEAKIDLNHIPYRSSGAAMPDLLAGQVDAICSDVTLMAPHIEAGKLIPLAVTAPHRSKLIPNVPTTAEAGLPNVQTDLWYGLLAPARTPAPILEKLKAAVTQAVRDPGFAQGLAKQGAISGDPGPEALAALIAAETRKWTPIVQATGLKF
jgi:tripartite-type tricarboxylate transporter receptor subunit TctC